MIRVFLATLDVAGIALLTPTGSVLADAASDLDSACTQAQTNGGATPTFCETTEGDPITGPDGIIYTVTDIVSVFAGVIAVIVIIVSGLRFVLANGDASKVTTARNSILYALVGLVVVVMSNVIIKFVLSKL